MSLRDMIGMALYERHSALMRGGKRFRATVRVMEELQSLRSLYPSDTSGKPNPARPSDQELYTQAISNVGRATRRAVGERRYGYGLGKRANSLKTRG